VSGEDGCVGAEVDGGGANGGEKCGGELARIEALLVEEKEAVVAGDELWDEAGEVFWREDVVCIGRTGRKSVQGCVGLEWDADAAESMEAVEKIWIEGQAEVGESAQLRRVVGIVGGEHASGGAGGFGERG
jgi:hypothetical protein